MGVKKTTRGDRKDLRSENRKLCLATEGTEFFEGNTGKGLWQNTNGTSKEFMIDWNKVTITAEEATQGRHAKIQDAFVHIFMKLGGNKELALLESGYNSDYTFNIYFTPKCYEIPALKVLIDSNDGVACEEPAGKEVGFAAGVAGVWEHLIRHPSI